MHHYILQHPEMYGLPRKFNIAFDGGGKITPLADTNDIGFFAVRVRSWPRCAARAFIFVWNSAASAVTKILRETAACC